MSEFSLERDRLIAEIAENLAKAITNVNQLNRNIENVHIVGSGLEPVNKLWTQFEGVMRGEKAANAESNPIKLAPPLPPQGTDETAILPAGIAPGQGEPVVLGATTTGTEQ